MQSFSLKVAYELEQARRTTVEDLCDTVQSKHDFVLQNIAGWKGNCAHCTISSYNDNYDRQKAELREAIFALNKVL